MVDAPVGRLAAHADRGESLFMVGGAEADFRRIRPLLDAMGTTIHHCGPVGTGGKTKLVNNYICVVLCQMNAEALALAQKFGLDLEQTLEVLNGTTATNGQLKINWPNKVLAGDISPGFTIDLAHKDLSLALAAGQAAKLPLALGATTREMMNLARAERLRPVRLLRPARLSLRGRRHREAAAEDGQEQGGGVAHALSSSFPRKRE